MNAKGAIKYEGETHVETKEYVSATFFTYLSTDIVVICYPTWYLKSLLAPWNTQKGWATTVQHIVW